MSESHPKSLTDCFFYAKSLCTKSDDCEFRHWDLAHAIDNACRGWQAAAGCSNRTCRYRHPASKGKGSKSTTCYYFTHGGCSRGSECHFVHSSEERLESEGEAEKDGAAAATDSALDFEKRKRKAQDNSSGTVRAAKVGKVAKQQATVLSSGDLKSKQPSKALSAIDLKKRKAAELAERYQREAKANAATMAPVSSEVSTVATSVATSAVTSALPISSADMKKRKAEELRAKYKRDAVAARLLDVTATPAKLPESQTTVTKPTASHSSAPPAVISTAAPGSYDDDLEKELAEFATNYL